jgi:thymidine kinase
MAKMIPEIDVGRNPHGEKLFYFWLKHGITDDYVVLHNVQLLTMPGDTIQRGEADFLILHPDKGFIVIEVKGGRIKRVPSKNQWVSVSHKGVESIIQDPFTQASKNMDVLAKKCREAKVFEETGNGIPVTYGYAVAFPDGLTPMGTALPSHVIPGIVIDHNDRNKMTERIDKLFEGWKRKHKGSRGFTQQEYKLLFSRVLMAHFDVTRPLYVRLDQEQSQFTRLTDTQCKILDAIPNVKRALFKGYAGTGKTQLLIERARRLAANGARVLILCFNEPLAEHLTMWVHELKVPITVRYFHGLCQEYAQQAGVEYNIPLADAPLNEQKEFYDNTAPSKLEEALPSVPTRFDCVLIDEGQDFNPKWFEVAMKLLDSAGMDIFYIFYDEQQNVYGKELKFPFTADPYELRRNCRSTKNICDVIRSIGKVPVECFDDSLEGEKVHYHRYNHPEEQVEIIEGIIKELLHKKIQPHRILILSSHKKEKSCLAKVDSILDYPLKDFRPSNGNGAIGFSSLHKAKGLESDVVIFCDVDGQKPNCSEGNQYVAVSRARHLLYIIHSNDWNRPR